MRRRACIVVSSEMTVRAFLARQMAVMQDRYDLTLVVNTSNTRLLQELGVRGTLRPMAIVRSMAPLRDLLALVSLAELIRRGDFALVQSMTPKAGLLAMMAARLAGTPVRIHTFTGQVWATRHGFSRTLLKLMDRLIARCATTVLTDSPSQRDFLIREGVAPATDLVVLGNGSVCGVDTDRFRPDAARRRQLRSNLGIPDGAVVLLFAGRLTKDKGVLDLARAFAMLAAERSELHLLVAGPDEQRMRPLMRQLCDACTARVHFLDFTTAPETVMAASDVLCLPSYREGFGNVVIEAAAAGVPAVASRIYGIVDAIEDGRTGLLHEPGDVTGLAAQVRRLVTDEVLRHEFGRAARARVERDFSQPALTAAMLDFLAQSVEGASPGAGSPRDVMAPGAVAGNVAAHPEGCGR
jgi:glycosyltransferase involved in cell wall biosynthesis